jgi:uncharacterized protein YcaQ
VIAERLTAQLLAGEPARDPVAATERLLAIQGQDLRGARLTIRSRTRGLSVTDFDRALADRTLLITWVNRGTLHLIRAEDYPWLHALTAPTLLRANERRLREEGVDAAAAERGVDAIVRALVDDGPQTRDQLRERVDAAGVPTAAQALVHVLLLASLRGFTVRGPMVGKQQAHVLVRDWLGEQPAVDRERALAELARRYLAGHGPADDRDLARWSGLPLRDVRAGLAAIAPQLAQRDDGLVDLAKRQPAAELPPPRLLGPFEPLLLGWVSREPILGDNTSVVTMNGIFKAIALVQGRAVATWTMPKGKVELAPFGRLDEAARAALEADAADLTRFLAP